MSVSEEKDNICSKIWNNHTCQACIDSSRLNPDAYLEKCMVKKFIELFLLINHQIVGKTYQQGESIIWFALVGILVWDSENKEFVVESINAYREQLKKSLTIFYEHFDTRLMMGTSQHTAVVTNFTKKVNPARFHKLLMEDPIKLVQHFSKMADFLINIERVCKTDGIAETISNGYSGKMLLFKDGKKYIHTNFGMAVSGRNGPGLVLTDYNIICEYNSISSIKSIIDDILHDGTKKVRISKNMNLTNNRIFDVKKRRWPYTTHLLKGWK